MLAVAAQAMDSAARQRVRPRLFALRPDVAILRVDHTGQRAVATQLEGLAVDEAQLRTVTTSGTLRQAKAAVGVRQSARRRRKPSKAGTRRPGP